MALRHHAASSTNTFKGGDLLLHIARCFDSSHVFMSTSFLLFLDICCYNQDIDVSFCPYIYILQPSSVYPHRLVAATTSMFLIRCALIGDRLSAAAISMLSNRRVITAYGLYCYNEILLAIDLLLPQRAVQAYRPQAQPLHLEHTQRDDGHRPGNHGRRRHRPGNRGRRQSGRTAGNHARP